MKLNYFIFLCLAVIFVGCADNSNNKTNGQVKSGEDTLTVKVEKNEELAKTDTAITLKKNDTIVELPIKEVSFQAYTYDPDTITNITNVRKTPNGEVILQLKKTEDYILTIIASQGRWFKVNEIESEVSKINIPGGSGWIHGSVIGFHSKGQVFMYEKPDKNSKLIDLGSKPVYLAYFRLLDIEGEWVKVVLVDIEGTEKWDNESEKYIGWMDKNNTCPLPWTYCN